MTDTLEERLFGIADRMGLTRLTSPFAHAAPRTAYAVSVAVLLLALIAAMTDAIILAVTAAAALGWLPPSDHPDATPIMRIVTIGVAAVFFVGAAACATESLAVRNARKEE